MPTQPDAQMNIDDMLVVTIRVRVAAFPTYWERRKDGGGYTLDNELAREICEQELEINLGPDEELILVLNEMAEAVQYDRLYGWMAQYRANLVLGAGEIAPDAQAHLHSISHEIVASLKQSASQSPDESSLQEDGLRVVIETIAGERLWEHTPSGGLTSPSYREDGTLASIISALEEALRQARGELGADDPHPVADVGPAAAEVERDVPPAVMRRNNPRG